MIHAASHRPPSETRPLADSSAAVRLMYACLLLPRAVALHQAQPSLQAVRAAA